MGTLNNDFGVPSHSYQRSGDNNDFNETNNKLFPSK